MKLVSSLAVLGLSVALVGCDNKQQPAPAAPQQPASTQVQEAPAQQPVSKTVEYMCGTESNEPVIVTYRFDDQQAVAADVVYKGQNVSASGFTRNPEDKDSARFTSADKFVWIADSSLTLDTVDKAGGNMLYVEGKESDEILVKYCSAPKSVK